MLKKKIHIIIGVLFLFSLPLLGVVMKQNPPLAPKKTLTSSSADTCFVRDSVVLSRFIEGALKGWDVLFQDQKEQEEKEARLKALETPAIDLYGANSWSNYVNPFGGRKVSIPKNFKIDCKGMRIPLDRDIYVTSGYGYRRRYRRMHQGVDIRLKTGDTVRALFDGKVRIRTYSRRGYGNYVVLRHPNGLETVYGHFSRHLVELDQKVLAGDPIGLGGSTGRSTAPHLHLETRFMGIPINPRYIIDFHNRVPKNEFYIFRGGNTSQDSFVKSSATSYVEQARTSKSYHPKGSHAHSGGVGKYYYVRRGDSLWIISRKTGVSVQRICRLNHITKRTVIRPGRKLRIR